MKSIANYKKPNKKMLRQKTHWKNLYNSMKMKMKTKRDLFAFEMDFHFT